MKQQLDEVTSKAKSLRSELLEPKQTNILLKRNLDEKHIANNLLKNL